MKHIVKITMEDSDGKELVLTGNYQNQRIIQLFGMISKPDPQTGILMKTHNGVNALGIVLGTNVICEEFKIFMDNMECHVNT